MANTAATSVAAIPPAILRGALGSIITPSPIFVRDGRLQAAKVFATWHAPCPTMHGFAEREKRARGRSGPRAAIGMSSTIYFFALA
jgi:hypothetical protein